MKLEPVLLAKNDIDTIKYIQHLRIEAWEDSGLIKREDYPDGLKDSLDSNGFHWVTFHKDKIVSAARVNILNEINEIPYHSLFNKVTFPPIKPFAHISRHVVKKEYRGLDLSTRMDQVRLEFIEEKRIRMTIAWAREFRIDKLVKYGFHITGDAHIDQFAIKDPGIKILHKINSYD